jgi:hypothetical protein
VPTPSVDPRGVVATPAPLARDLAACIPTGAPVLDPACGEGALLLAARDIQAAPRPLIGLELDPGRAGRARNQLGRAARIENVDALDPNVDWPGGTWVLANPPWCSFSGRQVSGARSREAGAVGWPSLHGAFLERIARHVGREGTGAAVLLPGSVVELERYGPLRAAVCAHAMPVGPPRELGEDAFPGVTEPAVLLELRPRRPGERASPEPWTGEPSPLVAALADCPRLPPGTFADPGVHSGNSARELVLPATRTDMPGLRQGRDLQPYSLGPPSARLHLGLERTPARRFRVPTLERMRAFPVLLRQTADRPMAALHTQPTWFRNSLLAARTVEGLDPRALVAMLNSEVLAAWHRAAHRDGRQRAFPQVKVRHMAGAPFPLVHRDEDPSLHDALVAAYGDGPSVDRLVAEAFGVTRSRTGS